MGEGEPRGSNVIVITVLLAIAIMLIDGYDMLVLALVIPVLSESWVIPASDFGWVQSAAVLGLGLGAGVIAPFGDRFGRRFLVLSSFAVIVISVLCCSFATGLGQMSFWRLLTGIGLGATLPNISALVAELAPNKKRSTLLTIIGIGISIGGISSALIVPTIIKQFGWPGVFEFSALISFFIWIFLYFQLPESPQYLEGLKAGKNLQGVFSDKKKSNNFFLKVLSPEYRSATLAVWLLFTGNAFILYVLVSWVPVLLTNMGWNLTESSRAVAYMQAGGLVGGVGLAVLMDRWHPAYALLSGYLIASVCLLAFSMTSSTIFLWGSLFSLVGVGILGVHMTLSAVVSMIYPAEILASGIGFTVAITRFGAVAGPVVGGLLIARELSTELFLGLLLAPISICIVCVMFLFFSKRAKLNLSERSV